MKLTIITSSARKPTSPSPSTMYIPFDTATLLYILKIKDNCNEYTINTYHSAVNILQRTNLLNGYKMNEDKTDKNQEYEYGMQNRFID